MDKWLHLAWQKFEFKVSFKPCKPLLSCCLLREEICCPHSLCMQVYNWYQKVLRRAPKKWEMNPAIDWGIDVVDYSTGLSFDW